MLRVPKGLLKFGINKVVVLACRGTLAQRQYLWSGRLVPSSGLTTCRKVQVGWYGLVI